MARTKKSPQSPLVPDVKLIEGQDTPNYYSNHIECRVSNEEVILTFALRKYSDPEKQAEALNRNYISVPHFVRLTTLMLKQMKKMVKMGVLPEGVFKDVSNELDHNK